MAKFTKQELEKLIDELNCKIDHYQIKYPYQVRIEDQEYNELVAEAVSCALELETLNR
jgi:hypothetical protein